MVKANIKAKIFAVTHGYAIRLPKDLVDTGILKDKCEYTFEIHIPEDDAKKNGNAVLRMLSRDYGNMRGLSQ